MLYYAEREDGETELVALDNETEELWWEAVMTEENAKAFEDSYGEGSNEG
jgi:hypothetical protein